jgi:hypothetical protein
MTDPKAVAPDARTITASEVRGWFKTKAPNEAQCAKIARDITRMRWPSDPPQAPLPDDAKEWYWRARTWQPTDPPLQKPDSVGAKEVWDFQQPRGPGGISNIKYVVQDDGSRARQEVIWDLKLDPEADAVEWWDLQGVAAAAKKLRDAIPLMLSYWDRVRRKRPEIGDRYDRIKALDVALTAAMSDFNPFGESKKSHRQQPKDWHIPAVLIAHYIGEALTASGHKPSLDGALVEAAKKALHRIGYTVPSGTISLFLKRRRDKFETPSPATERARQILEAARRSRL